MALDRTQKFAMATGGQGVSIGDVADFVGGGGASVLLTARVELTSAQLLSLFSAPVEIIPAPEAGSMIQFFQGNYHFTFGTTPYVSTANDEALYYGNGTNADSGSNGAFQGTADSIETAAPLFGSFTPSLLDGANIVLTSPTADMTGGDGTLNLTVFYTIVNL